MKLNKLTLLVLVIGIIFTSCSSDDDAINVIDPRGDYENGLIISHEGGFGNGDASISYVSYDYTVVENNVFSNVNNELLGDTAQSMAFNGDLAYVIMNGSATIEVVNRYTFQSIATIDSGLDNARYMAISNGKGYVTNWGDGNDVNDDYVAVINLTSNMVENTISVGEGPESIVTIDNKIYVALKGGYNFNNKIAVIDASTNVVIESIIVGYVPNSMSIDNDGNLWVLSSGVPSWSWTLSESAGQLSKINTGTNTIVSTIDFATTEHPDFLAIDNSSLYYYLNTSVYKIDELDTILPTASEFTGLNFYDMTVNNGMLYGLDAEDYINSGTLKVYDLSTNVETNSITIGIIPGEVYFN